MRRILMIAGLAAAVAAPSLADARTYCEQRSHDRKVTGTVLGALGGALIGNAVSHRGGALVGGLGGAVVGNQIARTKCEHSYSYNRYYRRHSRAAYRSNAYAADTYGRPVSATAYAPAAYDTCHYETRPFYNDRGQLIYQSTRVCGR